ncbi:MAG: DUF859 family phage minor structural protein [Christensenellales bacterium]|jgi:hypothetical protein
MAITATYTVTLSASDKDHARGEYVYASIVRTFPATLVPEGLYVQSATINMTGTTFWSGSGYNPYLDFGDIGRVFVSTSVTDKTAIPITTPTDFNLDELLSVGTVLNNFYIYGYKSSNGNVCTYPSNNAQFTITATVVQQYAKSSARVTSSVEAGSASTVTFINPYLSNVYHVVDWRFGTKVKSTTTAVGASSTSYTIPLSWLTVIPSATSGTATVSVTTYASGGLELGTDTYSFTITAPSSAVPTLSLAAARINNSVPSSWGIYVQGQSGVTITATAAGYQGSTISSYTISGGATGTQSSNVFTISTIYSSGTITYTVKVTDSRGRTATASTSISVVAYSAPAFSATDAFRCIANGTASDTGTYISAKATGTFSSVSSKNSMTLKVQYALSTSGAYSTAVTLTNGTASIIGNGSIDINYSFKVKFTLADQFNTIEKVLNVGTAAFTVFFRQGGNGVAIGKVSERASAVEINPDWDIYHGSTKLNGTVPISRGGTGGTTAAAARSNLGAVNKAGDTMTGNLNIQGTLYPSMLLKPTQSGQTNQTVFEGSYVGASSFAAWEDTTGNNRRMLEVRTKAYAASLDNAVMVRVCDGGTWGNYRVYHEGMETVIPLSKGGTGGTSAATARSKIGANNASNLTTGTLPAARLPFKIQYGQTTVTGVSWTTVSLTAGFTATPTIIVSYAGNPSSSGIAVLKTGSESTTSFQVCMAGSSGSGSRKVNWIAIGT